MKPLQVLSLIFAIILLLPGLCFFGFGSAFIFSSGPNGDKSMSGMLLVVGVVIFGLVGLLGRFAFRKAPPPARPPGAPDKHP
jgi:hypothetical protein